MTDTLDTRPTTGVVTAYMDAAEHPIRRPSDEPAIETSRSDESASLVAEPMSVDDDEMSFPAPPERGSLDDEDLVPLVGRHTDDTATIDLIGILQAQMHLRSVEAARFSAWEEQMRRIGTDEALGELERTRLHFTGVIPVQMSQAVVSAGSVPATGALVAERVDGPAPAIVRLESIPDSATATADVENVHEQRARLADEKLLELDDTASSTVSWSRAERTAITRSPFRIVVLALTVLAALVVGIALVLTAVGGATAAAAVLGAVAILGAAWLGLVAGRVALRTRRQGDSAPVTSRTSWALVAGLVVGTALGEGLVRSAEPAFSWQGYILRLVDVQGLYPELSLVAGIVASLIVAFVVVVLVDRARPSASGDLA